MDANIAYGGSALGGVRGFTLKMFVFSSDKTCCFRNVGEEGKENNARNKMVWV